jgi:hypothetical protein
MVQRTDLTADEEFLVLLHTPVSKDSRAPKWVST